MGRSPSTHPVELSALVMKEALDRAGVDPAIVDDVAWGCAMPEASQGLNVARLVGAARRAARRSAGADDQSILLVGAADDRRRRDADHERHVRRRARRRRRDDEPGADVGLPRAPRSRSARVVHRHGLHRRARRRAMEDQPRRSGRVGARQPAEGGERDGERRVRRPDRARAGGAREWEGTEKKVETDDVRARRAAARRDDRRGTREAQAGVQGERHRDGGQREPVLRRRGRGAADAPLEGGGARPQAARALRQLRRRRRRSRRDGRRPDQGGAEGARSAPASR